MPDVHLQIMSDLHLEAPAAYDIFEIAPKAPILALLGDIGQARDPGYVEFLERQLSLFSIVLLVLGNHEPYNSDWDEARKVINRFNECYEQKRTEGQGRLILLDKTRFDVTDELTILGCTLHSNVDPDCEQAISMGINDFYYIGDDWDVSKHRQAHLEELAWLNEQVTSIGKDSPNRRIAILTHHSPCTNADSTDPKHVSSRLKSGFATDLSGEPCWKNPAVRLWAFGHTHYNCSFSDSSTGMRVVTNQRGYYFAQASDFDASKVVTI